MQQFDITLVNEKERSYRMIIFLLVILHIVLLVYLLFHEMLWKDAIVGLIFITSYSGYRIITTKRSHQKFSFGSGFFFLFGVVAIVNISWVWVLDIIFYILSTIALMPYKISFSKSDIIQTGFPRKKYNWDQFNNVMIKDNFLTLDFKNNKLLQAKIESQNLDENIFNSFAAQHINKQ